MGFGWDLGFGKHFLLSAIPKLFPFLFFQKMLRLLLIIGATVAQQTPITSWYTQDTKGVATYYGAYGGNGACQLDQGNRTWVPAEIRNIDFTVAMNGPQYALGACGMCLRVTGTGQGKGRHPVVGTYYVYVNNLCPECEWGHLDFGNMVGDGLWDVSWRAIPCDATTIKYRMIGHKWWFKISPQATRYPVRSFYIFYGGKWVRGQKDDQQYYVFQSTNDTPFVFPMRVAYRSIYGQEIRDTIQSMGDFVKSTSRQFPLVKHL